VVAEEASQKLPNLSGLVDVCQVNGLRGKVTLLNAALSSANGYM
jgi:hypothetical protein